MKKITLLLLLIISFSCEKASKNKETTIGIEAETNKQDFLYKYTEISQYIKFNTKFSEYEIHGLENPKKFTVTELNESIKENEFEYTKSDAFKYYVAKTFDIDKVNYKVIIYNTYGENDSKVLNIQLNSYLSGTQIDALLLDCRFTFETEYYRKFVINKDKTIDIKKIAVEKLLYNDDGDIVGVKNVNDTIIEPVKYKIEPSGKFLKM